MNNISSAPDFKELQARLVATGVDSVIEYLVGKSATRSSNRMFLGNVQGEPGKDGGGSLVITLSGKNEGLWIDNATGDKGDLIEFWMVNKGIDKSTAYKEICAYLGLQRGESRPELSKPKLRTIDGGKGKSKPYVTDIDDPIQKPANPEYLAKATRRLYQNEDAYQYLYERGLSDEAISYFGLGLSTPYQPREGVKTNNKLRVPLMNANGVLSKRSAIYHIDGVSEDTGKDPKSPKCKGLPVWCYNMARTNQRYLFIAEGMKDLWLQHQKMQHQSWAKDVLIISSSHGSAIPAETLDPAFFEGFDKVFCGQDNDLAGDNMAANIAKIAGKKAHRLTPPGEGNGEDWTDFYKNGGTSDELAKLMKAAEPIKVATPNNFEHGQHYDISDIDVTGCAYLNGHLYYPIKTLYSQWTQDKNGDAVMGVSKRVRVVRSDRKVMEFRKMPMLQGDDIDGTLLYELVDGDGERAAVLTRKPQVSSMATWNWSAMERWLAGKAKARHLSALLDDLVAYYKSQLYLQHENDYWLLGLLTVVTHTQQVFESVPYLFAKGPAGSGKSTLGRAMVNVCANAQVVGQASAAGFSRIIDASRGFIVLDDLEKLATKQNDAGINDLLQFLKTGYSKATAERVVIEQKNGDFSEVRLNAYGVKMFSNTSGIEDIVGTRTITIGTQKVPKGEFKITELFLPDELIALRNELHCWAFDHVARVKTAYDRHYPCEDRVEEIMAPLRALAELTEDPCRIHGILDEVAQRRAQEQKGEESPSELVQEAVFNLARNGYTGTVMLEHVILEMKSLVPSNYGKTHKNEIPEWQDRSWVKSQLVGHNWIDSHTDKRQRVNRKGKALRVYTLTNAFRNELKERYQSLDTNTLITKSGSEFCKIYPSCRECPYETQGCEFTYSK